MFDRDKLKRLREEKGLTLQKLAEKVGCSAGLINHFELGYKPPTFGIAENIANFFGLKLDDFVKCGSA